VDPLLRMLHIAGGVIGFAVAPLALIAVKGSRKHVVAGRVFALGMAIAAIAGIALTLSVNRHAVGLLLQGFLLLFLTGVGYLAPRIGHGSRASYRWDRVLTALGGFSSAALMIEGLRSSTLGVTISADAIFGALGVWLAVRHLRWRGPID